MLPALLTRNESLFCCPSCGGALKLTSEVRCSSCAHSFPVDDGLPLLFWANDWKDKSDVTDRIKAFYEKTPFPDYEDLDSADSLRRKSVQGFFARLLDEQIPSNAKVLEVGCGTGQLSNFLGLTWGRTVIGADMCLNSLRLGQAFSRKNEIASVAFTQMNLFRPVFRPGSFDVVICNGVLHHTSDPYLGFQSILKLVKKGGHIVIGLYHAYSRIPTDIRRFLFRISGNRLRFLDYRLRQRDLGDKKKNSWFMDQYNNPHESKHTFDDALDWFKRCGVEFVHSIPRMQPGEGMAENEKLFEPVSSGSRWERFLVEAGMLVAGDREGGFFVVIGKKAD